jgi:hypothetical protein
MVKSDSTKINGQRIMILLRQNPTNNSKTEKLSFEKLHLLKSYPTKDRISDFCTPCLLILFEIVVKYT